MHPRASMVGLITLTAALLTAVSVCAQNVGTIRGSVNSPDGEPLPGVLVQVTGDLVRGDRTSITGATGEYLIGSLPPGTVTVTATLTGFMDEKVEGVRVSISGVATVNLTMRLEGVKEAITVTSSTVLDVTSSSLKTSYQAELIDAKPTTQRNFQELPTMAPGVNSVGRIDIVGRYSGFVSAYGRDEGSVAWNVDGLSIQFPDTGNIFGGWVDPDTIAEIQVLGVGAPAEYGGMTGGAVNVVTKSGTNTLKGRVAYSGEYSGTTATGAKVEDFFGVERGFDRDTYEVYSLAAGGPLKKDKLFAFLSLSFKEDLLLEPGETPGIPIPASTADHYNVKLDWSITPSHTLTGAYQYEDLAISKGDLGRIITNPDAVATEYQEVPYYRFGYQAVLGASNFFEANWSDIINEDRNVSATGSLASPFINYNTSPVQSSGGRRYPYLYPVWWNRGHAKLTHFADDLAGSHEFKFGVQYSTTGEKAAAVYPGFGGKYYYKFGANYYVYSRAAHYYGADTEGIGLYVDDSWRINDRLTLNVGVRTDHDKGEIPSYPILESYLCDRLNCGVTTGEFTPAYPDVVDYDSIDPRIGIAYEVGEGRRQGVLRAFAGRYHEMNVVSMWQQPHPDRPVARYGYSPNRYGPFTYFRELGDGTFGLPREDLERPQTDQFSVGYEQRLGDYVLGAQIVKSETTDIIGWQLGDDGAYTDVPYVNPLTGETIILKNMVVQPTLRKGNAPGALANAPPGTRYEQDYTGVFLTFAKRHTGRWSLDSSLGWSEVKGVSARPNNQSGNNAFYTNSDGSDPNHHLYQGGLSQSDRPWVFRTQGMFDLPWKIKGVGVLSFETGRPYRESARVRLRQGFVTVPLEPYSDDKRMPDRTNIDLGLMRRFAVGDRFGLNVDLQVLNLLNDDGFYYWTGLGRYPTQPTPNTFFFPRRMALRVSLDF